MTDPAKYWPGGIPDDICCHPEPFEGDLGEEIKGWQLFLEETATGRNEVNDKEVDDTFEVMQRRRLVCQWARMTQDERDTYQSRAPIRQPLWWYPSEKLADPSIVTEVNPSHVYGHDKDAEDKSVVCITATASAASAAEEGSPPLSRRDAALWAKQRILCYRLDARAAYDTIFVTVTDDHAVGVAVPNAASGDSTKTVTPYDFLRWCHVEAADFDRMVMTSRGTVLFISDRPGVLFVDREALDSGPALLCALENNGAVSLSHRVWPLTLKGRWWPDEHSAEAILAESSLVSTLGMVKRQVLTNMEKGILDFLDEFGRFTGGSPDLWQGLIERFAPGYLELEHEGHGMAYGYDHSRFRNQKQIEQLPPFRRC
ncbi:hypothetical protein PG993_003879 [Apiospora rasikravindrae]|uniref:Uncharacterized protein n=1 Tax=Apiospora rasikravindrae TaxID=990691 RepID=A0ABR1U0S2_9PEZI